MGQTSLGKEQGKDEKEERGGRVGGDRSVGMTGEGERKRK